ncbi:antibiotic biosynthesis monooxygenase [Paractinoplanes deccanensis]|uniref:Antibiotic biosynthesis monooxygenase n=1 Tax=Paractinoplanes deccanensis TaxID=113561 RepID=A0ABQ3XZ86_9ACTN|nr:antibiotic biosynthesis monooxygenase [Actinoplanes deccanensis]GID73058.1 antibiotic biosynthesis monooxygenase [Actinoplanes deccanensis]
MPYGYIASMKTQPGRRDEVIAILTSGADGLKSAGCELYVVSAAVDDEVTIWVTEVWQSKKHHDDSLHLPETRAAIAQAMPMLAGDFFSQETEVIGGLGVTGRP